MHEREVRHGPIGRDVPLPLINRFLNPVGNGDEQSDGEVLKVLEFGGLKYSSYPLDFRPFLQI